MPSDAAIATFKSSLRGELVQPSDANYNEARKIYNAMQTRSPVSSPSSPTWPM